MDYGRILPESFWHHNPKPNPNPKPHI